MHVGLEACVERKGCMICCCCGWPAGGADKGEEEVQSEGEGETEAGAGPAPPAAATAAAAAAAPSPGGALRLLGLAISKLYSFN